MLSLFVSSPCDDHVVESSEVETNRSRFELLSSQVSSTWNELLDMRRKQMKEGKPVDAQMSDVYKAREANE